MSAVEPQGQAPDELRQLIHDLRTPVTVITGFVDLLERGGEDLAPDRRAEFVSRIAEATRELREILDDQRPDGSL